MEGTGHTIPCANSEDVNNDFNCNLNLAGELKEKLRILRFENQRPNMKDKRLETLTSIDGGPKMPSLTFVRTNNDRFIRMTCYC